MLPGEAKVTLRRLEPSCIVFDPKMIEATTPTTPIAQGSGSLSITGEVAGQRSVAFGHCVANVGGSGGPSVHRWPQSHIGDPEVYKRLAILSSLSPSLSLPPHHHHYPCPLSCCPAVLTVLSVPSFICTGTSHSRRSPLLPPLNLDALQVIRHDRLKHDVRFIGTPY